MSLDPELYTVVWIAPLRIEFQAAMCMLDRKHAGHFAMQRGDEYFYHAGEMCGHNIVIATLPDHEVYGTGAAAALASHIKKVFPNLWFGLLVGVAAGLPLLSGPSPRDIRLGDVLVAMPTRDSAGLIAYDLGKETLTALRFSRAAKFWRRRSPLSGRPLGASGNGNQMTYYNEIKNENHDSGTFADPGQASDQFYDLDGTGQSTLYLRKSRPDEQRTRIWYGPIGSGEKVIKNAVKRNELRDRYNIIGLEMEAAGTVNRIPVGVIRGVCDYGDEYKHKEWQPYAAAMAAAYAKAVLAQIGPRGPTTVYHLPFRRNMKFTGRKSQLEDIEQLLFHQNTERVAVVGLGGMGKTQIALELAYRVKNMDIEGVIHKHSVFWVPAQSIATFETAAQEIVNRLNIQCDEGADPKRAFREYFASDAAGHWFMVLDNLDDAAVLDGVSGQSDGLFDFIPRSEKGRLVVTTRQTAVAVDTNCEVVELSAMTFDDASCVMERLLVNKRQMENPEVTKQLLEKLTYFPLALAQAAAYMNKTGTPITRYLDRCRSADQTMIDLLSRRMRDETHHSEAQGAVVTTWTVSLEAIREADKNVIPLLSFIRWIEPKAMPVSMLPTAASQFDLDDAIGLLCGYGFLSWREDDKTLDMHSLVHLVLQLWLDQETDHSAMTKDMAIAHIVNIFPTVYIGHGQVWRPLLPHVVHLIQALQPRQHQKFKTLVIVIASCLHLDGWHKKVVQVLEAHVAALEQTNAEIDLDRLRAQRHLCTAYTQLGQTTKAFELIEHWCTVQEITRPKDARDHQLRQYTLATMCTIVGHFRRAINLVQDVLAQNETLEADDDLMMDLQCVLAAAYTSNGEVNEAIKMLEPAVSILERELPETHDKLLNMQTQLADAYSHTCEQTKAIRILECVVNIENKTLLGTHSSGGALRKLVALYRSNGQIEKAVATLEDVLAMQKRVLPAYDLELLGTQYDLAYAYRCGGQLKEATQMLESLMAVARDTLPESNILRLVALSELACLYKDTDRLNEAIEAYKTILATNKEALAETNRLRLGVQHRLGIEYLKCGQIKEAVKLLEIVVALRQRTLEENDPVLLEALDSLEEARRVETMLAEGDCSG